MVEIAFDVIVSELLWLGLSPKVAHNFACLNHPNECLDFQSENDLEQYSNIVFDYRCYKFDDYQCGSDYSDRKDAIQKIK